jgi:non-homologous end joining protein Ku
MKDLILKALEDKGYEVFDERFVTIENSDVLTIAWDDDSNKIEIAEGDYRNFYNNYDNVIVIGENSDLDKIFEEIN